MQPLICQSKEQFTEIYKRLQPLSQEKDARTLTIKIEGKNFYPVKEKAFSKTFRVLSGAEREAQELALQFFHANISFLTPSHKDVLEDLFAKSEDLKIKTFYADLAQVLTEKEKKKWEKQRFIVEKELKRTKEKREREEAIAKEKDEELIRLKEKFCEAKKNLPLDLVVRYAGKSRYLNSGRIKRETNWHEWFGKVKTSNISSEEKLLYPALQEALNLNEYEEKTIDAFFAFLDGKEGEKEDAEDFSVLDLYRLSAESGFFSLQRFCLKKLKTFSPEETVAALCCSSLDVKDPAIQNFCQAVAEDLDAFLRQPGFLAIPSKYKTEILDRKRNLLFMLKPALEPAFLVRQFPCKKKVVAVWRLSKSEARNWLENPQICLKSPLFFLGDQVLLLECCSQKEKKWMGVQFQEKKGEKPLLYFSLRFGNVKSKKERFPTKDENRGFAYFAEKIKEQATVSGEIVIAFSLYLK